MANSHPKRWIKRCRSPRSFFDILTNKLIIQFYAGNSLELAL